MERVQIWGPAADMSMACSGYFVRNEEGKWLRTTIVVVPPQLARTAEELAVENGQHYFPEDAEALREPTVPVEQEVSGENAVQDNENVVVDERVLVDAAVRDDENIVDSNAVIGLLAVQERGTSTQSMPGPYMAEQVLTVDGELVLRELGPGEHMSSTIYGTTKEVVEQDNTKAGEAFPLRAAGRGGVYAWL